MKYTDIKMMMPKQKLQSLESWKKVLPALLRLYTIISRYHWLQQTINDHFTKEIIMSLIVLIFHHIVFLKIRH